jgi:glycerol kinase
VAVSGSRVLVVDVGTTSVRASVVDGSAEPGRRVFATHRRALPPVTPLPGLVEFDAAAMAAAALDVAAAALADGGPVAGVGVANQRASAVVWDPATGQPVGPGLGWQDLRTVGACLELQGAGLHLAPNQTATKVAWLLDNHAGDRRPGLVWGTVDAWIVWHLTEGSAHLTDASNAAVTGLLTPDGGGWDMGVAERLGVPESSFPVLVDSAGVAAEASALPGAPPVAGIAGDQQASLVGQGCTRPGLAKITFGTGGMLDLCSGDERPGFAGRGPGGCFPIVAWRRGGRITWGVEAIMLTAGTAVDWLVDDLGLIGSAAESETVAGEVTGTEGVVFVPALLGLGTPAWDFGARGSLLGVSRGTTRAHLVRAVLEGVAHRGADLLEAAEADTSMSITSLRVDGGMSANGPFLQALADACGRPVEVSPQLEATTLGAGLLAGLGLGLWPDEAALADTWAPRATVEPSGTADRDRWRAAVDRARSWYPELSGLSF